VGCGVGFGSAILANTAAHVTAIDNSSHALRFAKKKYSRPNVQYTKMDAHHLSFADRCFDVVISSEVFEHLPNQKQHLCEVRRVLNEDGFCFVGVPHPEQTGNTNKFHAKENTPEEMRELLLTAFGDVVIVDPRKRNERQEIFGINVKVPRIPDCISFFCFAR
jgi:ubiquinone/menaquinone biosynthesis C-methylase UbiE